jgi:hypothetical protein
MRSDSGRGSVLDDSLEDQRQFPFAQVRLHHRWRSEVRGCDDRPIIARWLIFLPPTIPILSAMRLQQHEEQCLWADKKALFSDARPVQVRDSALLRTMPAVQPWTLVSSPVLTAARDDGG